MDQFQIVSHTTQDDRKIVEAALKQLCAARGIPMHQHHVDMILNIGSPHIRIWPPLEYFFATKYGWKHPQVMYWHQIGSKSNTAESRRTSTIAPHTHNLDVLLHGGTLKYTSGTQSNVLRLLQLAPAALLPPNSLDVPEAEARKFKPITAASIGLFQL